MADLSTYADRYDSIRLERRDGILQVTIHQDGGEAVMTASSTGLHHQLGDAFYQIGRDPENRVVILTGAGDAFLTRMEVGGDQPLTTAEWDRIYKEGKDLLQNLLEIEVPVIGAANGPAFIHAELLTLSDIVIASERASFADKAHAPGGVVPSDGAHVWWPMLLGPNRGRHFLMTGCEISAQEAVTLGFVAEVVPHERTIERAWEVARELTAKPQLMLRYTRVALTQPIKRRMLEDLGYGLALEGLGILSLYGK
jgi:enoyl-CoA hydratase/carnithine racemase